MPVLSGSIDKVESAIDTVAELDSIDFPHADSKEALRLLNERLVELRGDLCGLDREASPDLIQSYCIQATSDISSTLEALGLIINSTSIRNAFEVHQSLLQVAKKLVDPEARLILSFEWNYVPFTYPLTAPYLPNFVVIGLPASEAGNALIIPAAGHELGHSIWRKHRVSSIFQNEVQDSIKNLITKKFWDRFKKSTGDLIKLTKDLDTLIGKSLWEQSYIWTMNQIEEIFCDIIGIGVFGLSYIHCFSYLIAPGMGGYRHETYPEISKRARFLREAAEKQGLNVPSDFESRFQHERSRYFAGQFRHLLLEIADAAVQESFDGICSHAFKFCDERGFKPPREPEWRSVVEAFRAHVPASKSSSLSSLLNGAWAISQDAATMQTLVSGNRRPVAVLNELLLKSIEIFEIENLIEDNESQTIKNIRGAEGREGISQ